MSQLIISVDPAELATILAALRFYQQEGQGEPSNRSDDIHVIATDADAQISLDAAGIDTLCERMRIPRKLDTDSTANWTRIPHETGQSERSDAGLKGFYSEPRTWVKFLVRRVSCRWVVVGWFLARRRVIHRRPPDCAPSIAGWLAGGCG